MYLAFWKEGRRGGSSELARQHGLGTPVTEAKAGPLELRRKRAEDTHLRKEGGGAGAWACSGERRVPVSQSLK